MEGGAGMDFEKFYRLMAAPMAAVFLMLALMHFTFIKPDSRGEKISLLKRKTTPLNEICDGRVEVLQIKSDGSTWINSEQFSDDQAIKQFQHLMENRAERVAYVVIEPGVSVQRAIDSIDKIHNSTDDLHMALLTKDVYDPNNINIPQVDLLCGVLWPDDEFGK